MNYFQKSLGVIALVWVFSFVSHSTKPPKKVLFVGNSYTYFWNLPLSVMTMAEDQELDLFTQQSTAGGVNLGQHWRGEKDLQTLEIIQKGSFDAVVLQDHSLQAIKHPDSLLHYGKLWADVIHRSGADAYVYLTWAREWDPYMQAPITEGYSKLAQLIDATVIPVGPAWERARSLRPDIDLYDPDGSHPSPTGTYLTACVFYGVLTGDSPIGLPHRLISKDQNEEKLYINIQSPNDAAFCQKVADEMIQKWASQN
ncbi:MAG: hypothetical protein AAFN10_07005 [Bacteroidota bacterium]